MQICIADIRPMSEIITRISRSITSGQQLLIVRAGLGAQNQVEAAVSSHFDDKAHLTMKNVASDSCEFVYRVKENTLEKANEKQMIDITQRLMKIEGVRQVNLVEQQDDISR